MPSGKQIVVRLKAPPAAVFLADPAVPLPPRARSKLSANPAAVTKLDSATTHSAAPFPSANPPAPPQPDPRELEAARRQQQEEAALRKVLGSLTAATSRLEQGFNGRLDEWQRGAIELAVTIAARL